MIKMTNFHGKDYYKDAFIQKRFFRGSFLEMGWEYRWGMRNLLFSYRNVEHPLLEKIPPRILLTRKVIPEKWKKSHF